MGSPSILLDHLLEPPGHGGHQAPQVVAVVHPDCPQLRNFPLPLLHVLGFGLPKFGFHPRPGVLDRVQVRTVAWPLGWIKFLETIASHGAWSGWVETLAKSP